MSATTGGAARSSELRAVTAAGTDIVAAATRFAAEFWARSAPYQGLGAYRPGSGVVRTEVAEGDAAPIPHRTRRAYSTAASPSSMAPSLQAAS